MNENQNQQIAPAPQDESTPAPRRTAREDFLAARELFRTNRRMDEVADEEQSVPTAKLNLDLFVEEHDHLELSDEIKTNDGLTEATIWVSNLSSPKELDDLLDSLVNLVRFRATVEHREPKESVAVLEVVTVEDDTYMDYKVTFAGPHVHAIVSMGRTWMELMVDTFEA